MGKENKKIAVIICYFGMWPWYFKYFLHSIAFNLTIDFIIVTDQRIPDHLTKKLKNLSIQYESLHDFKKLLSRRLKITVEFTNPYKINDFKPAYGVIFSDLIKGYDFWGHGDIDVIFGEIRAFITNEVLEKNDIVSVRHDHLTGFFTLYRNCRKMNYLYKKSKDYLKVFSNEKHFCFDETNFAYDAFGRNLDVEEIFTEIESMTHVVKRMQKIKFLSSYFDFHAMDIAHGRIKWINGKLFYKETFEILLYHLINLKKVYNPEVVNKIPESFYISSTRIYKRAKRI